MTLPRPRSQTGTTGIKALLATLSLAATVGGWAILTTRPQPTVVTSNGSSSQTTIAGLPPIPTLVSPPANLQTLLTGTGNASTGLNLAPQPPAVLRSVSLPPMPAALTQSSR